MKEEICALYADEDGAIFDAPGIAGLGRSCPIARRWE